MDADDEDQMSMDTNDRDIDDRDRYSASAMDEDVDGDGMSDDTSLVAFGEGAGSTVSGPTYNRRDLASSPAVGKSGLASQLQSSGAGTPVRTIRRALFPYLNVLRVVYSLEMAGEWTTHERFVHSRLFLIRHTDSEISTRRLVLAPRPPLREGT